MKKMKVIWTGPECAIPPLGKVRTGQEVLMPEYMAQAFIKQGKAKRPSTKRGEK